MFDVDVKYIGDDIVFEVWTENTITSDEMIGQFRMKMSALCTNKGVDDWWSIMFKDAEVGKLHISSNWKPHEVAKKDEAPAAAPAQQQQ